MSKSEIKTDSLTVNTQTTLSSPTLTGTAIAPTPATNDNSTKIATTAFVNAQGFLTSTGAIPTGEADNATGQTSATTTFVTCLTTTVTLTQTAAINAVANATLTTTSSASVAGMRITINSVASRTALLTLSAITTNYMGTVNFISASLAPGTYTVTFDIQRSSGTGTVNFVSGTLVAVGLQGTNSNGITQLTGALQAGPGSGSQALTGTLPVTNGGTGLSSTTINRILFSSATNVIGQIATANTGALVTSNTGVPSIVSGATANRLLRTNGTTVSFAQAVLTTDVSGILPVANGGTGLSSVASQRIPFGTGSTALATDGSFIYDTTNQRLSVGGFGTATGNFLVTTGSKTALQAFNQSAGNAFQATNVSAWTAALISRQNNGATGASISLEFGRGTPASPTGCLNGDQIGVIAGLPDASDGVAHGYSGAISFVASEDALTTSTGGELVLSTTPNGGNILPVERVRVKNSGETVFQQAIVTAQFTTTQKNALTPSFGWVVFDTTLNQLSYYNGTVWVNL